MNQRWTSEKDMFLDYDSLNDICSRHDDSDECNVELFVEPEGLADLNNIKKEKNDCHPFSDQVLPTERPKPLSVEEQDSICAEIAASLRGITVSEEEALKCFQSQVHKQKSSSREPEANSKAKVNTDENSESIPESKSFPNRRKNVALSNLSKLKSAPMSKSNAGWVPFNKKPFATTSSDFPPL